MLDTTKCKEEVEAAKGLAESLGGEALDSFKSSFSFLENFRCQDPSCRVILTRDDSPHSFYFRIFWGVDQDYAKFTGAVLYYAGDEAGSGDPQYSVSLSGHKHARWEIHT